VIPSWVSHGVYVHPQLQQHSYRCRPPPPSVPSFLSSLSLLSAPVYVQSGEWKVLDVRPVEEVEKVRSAAASPRSRKTPTPPVLLAQLITWRRELSRPGV
jgi:hypothetical protein